MASTEYLFNSASVRAGDAHTTIHRLCCCSPALSKRYKSTCVTTRGAFAVLLWSAVVNGLGFGTLLYFITTPLFTYALPVDFYYMIGLLLYPVAALVGELRWTRYKSLMVGSIMVAVGLVSFIPSLAIAEHELEGSYRFLLSFFPVLLLVPGVALFQSNVLQHGTDQLDFASSEVVSSFVFWYYWTGFVFLGMTSSSALFGASPTLAATVTSALLTILICGVTFPLLIYCCCKSDLRMNRGDRVNPAKLIWRVMRFAGKNKNPLFRSAFTYNEIPSRLDLAKQRYGGPFTTWEVEDVKSFWQIFFLLVSLVGFQLRDDTQYTSVLLLALNDDNVPSDVLTAESAWTVSALVIIVSIPVYQFIIRPYFSRYIPRMLTRMRFGLVVELVSLLVTTVFTGLASSGVVIYDNVTCSYSSNNSTCTGGYCLDGCLENSSYVVNASFCSAFNNHFYFEQSVVDGYIRHNYTIEDYPSALSPLWLTIPQALNGFAHMLVFLTALEFILAQAPHTMQGFLIGLWYAMQSISVGIGVVGNLTCAVFHWWFYAGKSLLLSLAIVLFVFVSRKYKYRKLNEDVDVNIQQEIEDVYERHLDSEV